MGDEQQPRRIGASMLRGLVDGVGRDVTDRVRQELGAARAEGDERPAQRLAAAALGGVASGVGQNMAALLRQELGTARSDAIDSARAAARGAGLLVSAAAVANTATLFVGIALWRGLGHRIGYAKSAAVVAGLAGAAALALANSGAEELGRVRRSRCREGVDVPDAVTAMIDATNAGDSDAFVAAFTPDARIGDFGREFHGHDGVREWDRTDNIGVGMHFDVVSVTATGPDAVDVVVDAASHRFNGRSTLRVVLRDGLIAALDTA